MRKLSKKISNKEEMKKPEKRGSVFSYVNNHIGMKLNAIFSVGLLSAVLAVVVCVSIYNTNSQIAVFTNNCEYDLYAITSFKDSLVGDTTEIVQKIAAEKNFANSVATGSDSFIKTALSEIMIDSNMEIAIVDEKGSFIYATADGLESVASFNGVKSAIAGTPYSGCELINNNLYAVSASSVSNSSGIQGAVIVLSCLGTDENVDSLKQSSGAEFTVIAGNMRAATSIVDSNGARQAGTAISDAVFETVNVNGQRYSGNADVLGEKYVVNYEPVTGSDGTVVGSLFTGSSLTETYRESMEVAVFGIIIGLIIFALVDLILMSVIKKGIVRPLSRIVEFSNEVSSGNLGIGQALNEGYDFNRDDEIGKVFDAQLQTVSFIRTYIDEISRSLNELSQGNLTFEIEQTYIGDFIEIRKALEQVKEKLVGSMSKIHKAAAILTTSASEISSASQSLAQGATEQAGSIQELNATIETVSGNINENAKSANDASKVTVEVGQEIQEGNNKVEEMMQAMRDIELASSKIRNIIKTIEDIAFQTNILALNAAVEAARAGSAGKGFAVVADEVRNLAGKSAEAAQNTTALIQNSLQLIGEGAKKADETAGVMRRVVEGTANVVSAIESISVASSAQAAAINQIQTGMSQIAQVVHTTSATAEESAATAEELSAQAKLLEQLVSTFQY